MKLKDTQKANKAQGANASVKINANPNIYPLVVLVFSMIVVSTVLQLVFLA